MAAAGSGSRPIAIPRPGGPRAAPKPVAGDDMGLLSQSLPPRAPVIGSLPAPKLPKNALMPDFALPPASPQAVSLLAAMPEVPVRTSRMAGVSSAPARSFLEEQSASAVKSSITSQSPTILFTLLEEREKTKRPASEDSEDDDVPLGGSRRPTLTSVGSIGIDSLQIGSASDARRGIRTSRLSSDATGDSDSDEEAGESGGEDDDLPFKFD